MREPFAARSRPSVCLNHSPPKLRALASLSEPMTARLRGHDTNWATGTLGNGDMIRIPHKRPSARRAAFSSVRSAEGSGRDIMQFLSCPRNPRNRGFSFPPAGRDVALTLASSRAPPAAAWRRIRPTRGCDRSERQVERRTSPGHAGRLPAPSPSPSSTPADARRTTPTKTRWRPPLMPSSPLPAANMAEGRTPSATRGSRPRTPARPARSASPSSTRGIARSSRPGRRGGRRGRW
jgi:hypothetical protein